MMILWERKCFSLRYFLKSFLSTSSVKTTENELIDYLELSVRGGKGGSGCASTQHLPRNKVKPDGGDGGSGGCIIFKGSPLKHDFSHIPSEIRGHSGMHGSGSYQRGLRGKDTIIHVPMGSLIGCQQSQKILAEIRSVDELYKAAAGGRGGKGNFSISSEKTSRSSSKNYMCRDSEDGHDGDIAELYLEMKIIADVGLVGLPNAGKSSILSAISAAKPKIASYPFTTLRPHVGVVHYDGYYRLTIADIPGLIEGSSLGYGLGISFLKHIERCLTLLYVVDMSDLDNEPTKTIGILEKELDSYKEGMTQRVTGIIANKIDLISGPEAIIELARNFPNYSVIPISASEHKNISSIRNILEPLKKLYQIEKYS